MATLVNVRLQELESLLKVDEHALEECCRDQPELYYKVAKHCALLTSQRDRASLMLKEAEARADAVIRADAEDAQERITETDVKNRVRLDPDVRKTTNELLQLNLDLGQFTALKEAFSQRGYILKDLVQLYIAGYYGEISATSASTITKNADAQKAREEMARIRKQKYDR